MVRVPHGKSNEGSVGFALNHRHRPIASTRWATSSWKRGLGRCRTADCWRTSASALRKGWVWAVRLEQSCDFHQDSFGKWMAYHGYRLFNFACCDICIVCFINIFLYIYIFLCAYDYIWVYLSCSVRLYDCTCMCLTIGACACVYDIAMLWYLFTTRFFIPCSRTTSRVALFSDVLCSC